MAFPAVVAGSAADTVGSTAAANPAVNLATSRVVGNGLLLCFNATTTHSDPGALSGWTRLAWNGPTGDSRSGDKVQVHWREIDGSEGSTVTVSTNGTSVKYIARCWQISGIRAGATPEISAGAVGSSGNANSDSLTAAAGAEDILWLSLVFQEGVTAASTSRPTNYTDEGSAATSGGGTATNARVAMASRQLNAATEDPGQWVFPTSDDWVAYTIAIRPAAGGASQNVSPAVIAQTAAVLVPGFTLAANPAVLSAAATPVAPSRIDQRASATLLSQPAAVITPDVRFSVNPGVISQSAAAVAPSRIDQRVSLTLISQPASGPAPDVRQLVTPALQSRPVAPVAPSRIDQEARPAALSQPASVITLTRIDQRVTPGAQSQPASNPAPALTSGTQVSPGLQSQPASVIAPSRVDQAVLGTLVTSAASAVAPSRMDQQVSAGLLSVPALAVAFARIDQRVLTVLLAQPASAQAPALQAGSQILPGLISAQAQPVAFVRLDQQVLAGLLSEPAAALAPSLNVGLQIAPPLIAAAASALAPARLDQQVQVTLLLEGALVLAPDIVTGFFRGGEAPPGFAVHELASGEGIVLIPEASGSLGLPRASGSSPRPESSS